MRSDGRTDPRSEAGSSAVRDDDGRSSKTHLSTRALAILVAASVVAVDQVTKWLAVAYLQDDPFVVVDGVLRFRLTYNTGASFSSFTNGGPVIALIGFGVIGFVFYILKDTKRRLEAVALGLVLGGAIGNLIDRVLRGDGVLNGAVVDFIDVEFFAVFNVADSAINIGVALLLVAAFWKRS